MGANELRFTAETTFLALSGKYYVTTRLAACLTTASNKITTTATTRKWIYDEGRTTESEHLTQKGS